MSALFARLVAGDRGQDLIEYALLASFIAVTSILGLRYLQNTLWDTWVKLWVAFTGA